MDLGNDSKLIRDWLIGGGGRAIDEDRLEAREDDLYFPLARGGNDALSLSVGVLLFNLWSKMYRKIISSLIQNFIVHTWSTTFDTIR